MGCEMLTILDIENLVPLYYEEAEEFQRRRVRSMCRKILSEELEELRRQNSKLSEQVSDYGWEESARQGHIQGMY